MNKKQAVELTRRLMYAKHNAGAAEDEPGVSWDLGVQKALFDLGANGQKHEHFIDGYIKTIMEYDKMMQEPDPKAYVERVEKECL
jgi:hypothetical protein